MYTKIISRIVISGNLGFKVTSLFCSCPSGKHLRKNSCASFTKILANYISEESLITTDYNKNIV